MALAAEKRPQDRARMMWPCARPSPLRAHPRRRDLRSPTLGREESPAASTRGLKCQERLILGQRERKMPQRPRITHDQIETKNGRSDGLKASVFTEFPSDASKYYCLTEFPIPAATASHVAIPSPNTALTSLPRKRRMRATTSFTPSRDAFGLPTENSPSKQGASWPWSPKEHRPLPPAAPAPGQLRLYPHEVNTTDSGLLWGGPSGFS